MLGTMGLASSIGLGLALAQDKKVIAIDGDGSVLMNFGTLPTIANNHAPNFILLIIDNGSYGSTGDQTTYTGMKTSLAEVARACGCDNVIECSAQDTKSVVETALAGDKMTIIISKCISWLGKPILVTTSWSEISGISVFKTSLLIMALTPPSRKLHPSAAQPVFLP